MMIRKIVTTGLMGLAALSLSTLGAHAERGMRGERPAFSGIDANADGAITPAEIDALAETRRAARFAGIDADSDGKVSRAELIGARDARAAARADRMIERADSDGDGALSPEEMRAVAGDRAGRRGGRDGHRGRDAAGLMERLDADGNGSVSEAEWTARGPRR